MKKIIIFILIFAYNQIFSMQSNSNDQDKKLLELSFLKTVECGNLIKFKELISQVNINCKDRNGNTALHYINGHTPIIKLLLEKKANILAKNNAGKLPIDYVNWNNNQDIAHILLYKHQEFNTLKKALFQAIITNNCLEIKKLAKQISMGVLFEANNNPLHIAIQANSFEAFCLILSIRSSLMFEENDADKSPLQMLPNNSIILEKIIKNINLEEIKKIALEKENEKNQKKILEFQADECTICFTKIQNPETCSLLWCGHNKNFHQSCLLEWLKKDGKCPMY